LQAQRAATFRSSAAARSDFRSGVIGQRSFPNRFVSSRSRHHRNDFGSFFFPYSQPFWDEESNAEANETSPPSAILHPYERISEPPAPKPLVIEIPRAANLAAAKVVPPTIFVLANGERLEARLFVLTASNLSFSVDRQQRTVPFDMLDINATINANHERGIDLRIPYDRNEILLNF
jgi:hypothetical protein